MALTLAALNAAPPDAFVAALAGVFEHAPWVAEAALAERPFATAADLLAAMRRAVEGAGAARRRALLAGHPELGARGGAITPDSVAEQAAAGLDRLDPAGRARFAELNAAYRARFGLPFILCVRRHGRASLLATFAARLAATPEAERATAEAEVMRIAAIRLDGLVGDGSLRTAGRVSTHVLDTVRGAPAEGVAVELVEIGPDGGAMPVARARTNADGRTDAPLIGGRPVPVATYELRFGLGDYHRRLGAGLGLDLPEPPFLDVVPLRFGVADPEGDYHVPLVASPWAYQTYRGS